MTQQMVDETRDAFEQATAKWGIARKTYRDKKATTDEVVGEYLAMIQAQHFMDLQANRYQKAVLAKAGLDE